MDSTRFVNWGLLSALFIVLSPGGLCLAEDVGRVRIADLAFPQADESAGSGRRTEVRPVQQAEQLNLATSLLSSDIPPGRVRLVQQSQVEPESASRATQQPVTGLSASLSGAAAQRSLFSKTRRRRGRGINTALVLGTEAKVRATTDGGDLARKSTAAVGLTAQQRTPIVTDLRIRGSGVGRLLASGSYWVPARMDLDTMLSKLDSRNIDNLLVIKGPYSSQYGPGFDFVDVDLLSTPRYANGYESHGSSSVEYKTNGEQWYGRQSVWGGSDNYGYRVSYGHRTGNDYTVGHGGRLTLPDNYTTTPLVDSAGNIRGSKGGPGPLAPTNTIPASYKSRALEVALGYDPTPDSSLEFNYLRMDQTDVEYPGLAFDMDFLVTDAYEVTYVLEKQRYFDRLTFEAWHNQTRFEGNSTNSGKRQQIPTLPFAIGAFFGGSTAVTDVSQSSTGYSTSMAWGDDTDSQLVVGVDLRYLKQELNDVEDVISGLVRPINSPIPDSDSLNPGVFGEQVNQFGSDLTLRVGMRLDWVETDAVDNVSGNSILSTLQTSSLDRDFALAAGYLTAEYNLNSQWTGTAGCAIAQRPPTLTELYSVGPFIGVDQAGLSKTTGDPDLNPARRYQIDLGLRFDTDHFRGGVNGFHAWVQDFIAYDGRYLLQPSVIFDRGLHGQIIQNVSFVNTDLATLAGFDAYGEFDSSETLTFFGTMAYTEGRDHSSSKPARRNTAPRGRFFFNDHEPLPGISPLETRIGARLHDASPEARWAVELEARIVDNQDRVADSLFEQETPGFTVWNVRSYWQARENLMLIAGVENFTDKFYQEHLDYRSGRGVYQPGINFYFSTELTY